MGAGIEAWHVGLAWLLFPKQWLMNVHLHHF